MSPCLRAPTAPGPLLLQPSPMVLAALELTLRHILLHRTNSTLRSRRLCVTRSRDQQDPFADGALLWSCLQLIATLLLDYDPAEPSSLSTIRSSLQILSEETQDPDAFYVTTSSEDESADEVQRMLETWSLDDSSMGFEFGEGSSSNGTSVSTGSEGDNVEFLRMLFPYR